MHSVLYASRPVSTRAAVRPLNLPQSPAKRPFSASSVPAGRVLQLQRTVGNRAVASLLALRATGPLAVQRHPEHAEEQEVQRHPEHAEEQEVQPTLVSVQTWPFKKKTNTVSQTILDKEQAMTAKYGVRIGPGATATTGHLSLKILNKIEKVLDQLPPEHLRGNSLAGGISSGAGLGAASAYDSNSRQIEMVVPGGVPDWLYPILDKSSTWQRWLMDVGAKAGYEGLGAKGMLSARRQVMGGGKGGKKLGGNLVEWTVRHEMGHAVDEQVKWTQHRAKLDECGGWQQHEDHNGNMENGDLTVLDVLLSNAGFTDHMNPRTFLQGSSMAQTLMRNEVLGRTTDLDPDLLFGDAQRAGRIRAAVGGFDGKWAKFLAIRKKALSQPWTQSDGGGSDLQSNGRLYFVDSYNNWTSVLVARRNADSLSRYMFSNPGEWFAEAYAAYYAPKPSTRNQLNASVRAMFARDLGAPNAQRDDDQGRPALATGPADQQRLRALVSDTDGLVATLADDTSQGSASPTSSLVSSTSESSV
jgi:hypothetical protein